MSKIAVGWILCVSVGLLAGGCGYLDDDIAMSDEQFESSFAGELEAWGDYLEAELERARTRQPYPHQ